ncbi:deoxyribonuclease TATDN2 [Mizuhopecten yessoensis]|uniref:Deoxyribonuclease TATDN2 n=1 Tax=Mizuhopecten yessoensis TaxID=6573 RepID=A0A210QGM3_MIZYE|nr:deoxyribonuclease TATDN2 [Mizuhopecten yessoensis]
MGRLPRQEFIFKRQIELAVKSNLPLVIHCRGETASDICLDVLTRNLPTDYRIHRHCFDGSPQELKSWKERFPNCKFGISPLVLRERNRERYKSLFSHLPLGRIIVETDAPYLPHDGGLGSPCRLSP